MTAELPQEDREELWELFLAIHGIWGEPTNCRPEDMSSRWSEFIQVKLDGTPSYAKYYERGCAVLRELRTSFGEGLYQYLLLDGQLVRTTETHLAELKRYIIDEFIRVYVSSGGFRSFGPRNYGGYVSGSRFRSQPPYRTSEDA